MYILINASPLLAESRFDTEGIRSLTTSKVKRTIQSGVLLCQWLLGHMLASSHPCFLKKDHNSKRTHYYLLMFSHPYSVDISCKILTQDLVLIPSYQLQGTILLLKECNLSSLKGFTIICRAETKIKEPLNRSEPNQTIHCGLDPWINGPDTVWKF